MPIASQMPTVSVAPDRTMVRSLQYYMKPAAPDNFLAHLAPWSVGAFYFGSMFASHQDSPATRQALYKTSFAYRHFLAPVGLRVRMADHEAHLFGKVSSSPILQLGADLARQIEGVTEVILETEGDGEQAQDAMAESLDRLRMLVATDSRLAAQAVTVERAKPGSWRLTGRVVDQATADWLRKLACAALETQDVSWQVEVTHANAAPHLPGMDDDSVQALVLTRLRLMPALRDLPFKVKSRRQRVTLHGKVRNHADKELAEQVAASTLGARGFRSQIVFA